MKRAFFALILVSAIVSHEICKDFSSATSATNNYCTDYTGHTCCSVSKDAEIQSTINGLGVTDAGCLAFIKNTTCAQCDSWGAHLFGSEGSNAKEFPRLCDTYCSGFYQACSTVSMNWPNGKSPFNSTFKRIADDFPTQSDFCNYYKPLTSESACYSGQKFVLSGAPAPAPGSNTLCLKEFGEYIGERPVKMVDPKDGTGLFWMAYQNGSIIKREYTTGISRGEVLRVNSWLNSEMGNLGLALHPRFSTNRKFYNLWTSQNTKAKCVDADWCNAGANACTNGVCSGEGTNLVQEYRYNSNTPPTLLRTIMEIQKENMNHNGGDLVFGSDGYLYISVGDGGGSNDYYTQAQNLNRRMGKILRIDVDSTNYLQGRNYAVPSDNPFVSTSKFPEIYAYGLRNPWRMSFDLRNPSYLFVGDVGEEKVEETNLIVKGGNYGWPWYEGTQPTQNRQGNQVLSASQRKDPITEVTHDQFGVSVIGGYVYRGSRDPCQYGKYIFGDWSRIGLLYAYESPVGSGSFSFNVNNNRFLTKCGASDCDIGKGVHAFSQMENGDVYLHSQDSTYLIAEPSYCGLTCVQTVPPAPPTQDQTRINPGGNTTPLSPTLTYPATPSTITRGVIVVAGNVTASDAQKGFDKIEETLFSKDNNRFTVDSVKLVITTKRAVTTEVSFSISDPSGTNTTSSFMMEQFLSVKDKNPTLFSQNGLDVLSVKEISINYGTTKSGTNLVGSSSTLAISFSFIALVLSFFL